MRNRNLWALLLCIIAVLIFPAAAEDDSGSPAQAQIERIVISYAAAGIRDEQALSALASMDPSLRAAPGQSAR